MPHNQFSQLCETVCSRFDSLLLQKRFRCLMHSKPPHKHHTLFKEIGFSQGSMIITSENLNCAHKSITPPFEWRRSIQTVLIVGKQIYLQNIFLSMIIVFEGKRFCKAPRTFGNLYFHPFEK